MRPILLVLPLVVACSSAPRSAVTPRTVAEDLLTAERRFSAAGLETMFAEDAVMPQPGGRFAEGRAAVLEALGVQGRTVWEPLRVGVSADGMHGFTFGYMQQTRPDNTMQTFKYLAYWVRGPQGWRVAVYRRRPAPPGGVEPMMPPALPRQSVPVSSDTTGLRTELMRREQAFSDDAQRTSLGQAFARFGSADAINMGGPNDTSFVVGAENIARSVSAGGSPTGSEVTWSADRAIVASSRDLGVTIGRIRATASGQVYSFFTIWRRARPGAAWLYVAE